MDATMSLLDTVWPHVSKFLPKHRPSPLGGRPRADDRLCLGGILWVLTTGTRWREIPSSYPSATTCWRRMRDWTCEGIWPKVWRRLLRILKRRHDLPGDEFFLDASFVAAKKGDSMSEKPSAARVRRSKSSSTAMERHSPKRSQPPAKQRPRLPNRCSLRCRNLPSNRNRWSVTKPTTAIPCDNGCAAATGF